MPGHEGGERDAHSVRSKNTSARRWGGLCTKEPSPGSGALTLGYQLNALLHLLFESDVDLAAATSEEDLTEMVRDWLAQEVEEA